MNKTIKYASLLSAAVMLVSCTGTIDERDGGDLNDGGFINGGVGDGPVLLLSADRTLIQSDGEDVVRFTVTLDGEPVTEGVSFYNAAGERVDIADFSYSTTSPGTTILWAAYGILSSNEISITAVAAEIPESLDDPHPDRTDFRARVLFTQFTGNTCGYCYHMMDKIDPMIADEEFGDNLVWVACHSYSDVDLAYIPSSYFADACGVSGYPSVNMDFKETTNNYKLSTDVYKEKVSGYLNDKEDVACGISVHASMVSEQIVAKVSVKSASSGKYRVSGILLEDGIRQDQSNLGVIDHDACIRHIDSGTGTGSSKVLGYELGHIAAGATAEYLFIWNLDELTDYYLSGGYWGGKGMDYNNLRLAFYVTTADETGAYYVNNVVACDVNAEVPFEYSE